MAAAEHAASSEERYRREREACSREFGSELERITSDIDDPIVKLRYLQQAIDRQYDTRVERVPYAPARRALFRLRSLEALDAILGRHKDGAGAAVGARTLAARRTAKWVVGGTLAASLLLLPALLAGVALQIEPPLQRSATLKMKAVVAKQPDKQPSAIVEEPAAIVPVAETLPADSLGLMPTTIWLADRGPGWELYSNGLRIETSYAVTGTSRRYRIHHRDTGLQKSEYSRPVGILFHTSESDLWPLEPGFSEQVRQSSSALLRYVKRTQAYNYLIDRYGRVYRVVDDDSRANHAGHAIWARDQEIYLDLNSAFLGVSFESRWEGGRTLPITRAQLIAGRNLTHYLRQRFAIAPQMCVTHGLTSVSPRQRLIGYHLDWARGFPFGAFGLPDLYAQPPPSVAFFGFGHDNEFLRAVGEPWPGLMAAQRMLADEARERAIPIEQLRRERQALYREWSRQAPSDAAVARESPTPRASDKRG